MNAAPHIKLASMSDLELAIVLSGLLNGAIVTMKKASVYPEYNFEEDPVALVLNEVKRRAVAESQ